MSVQLTHSGAFADQHVTGVRPKGPSAVFNAQSFGYPLEMSEADMDTVQQEFVQVITLSI